MAAESQTETGNCSAWAAKDPSGILSPHSFNRRTVRHDDVSLRITHCGVCYADVIWTKNRHNDSVYPLVPGHEIAGVVTEVGSDVKGFKLGDHVAVGTYVNSCRDCDNCNSFLENHCSKFVFTFNGVDTDGAVTKGGYSTHIVVHERLSLDNRRGNSFLPPVKTHVSRIRILHLLLIHVRYCYKIPDGYPLEKAAPLVCAGITVYTPMTRHNMNQPGKSLGVIGLGGLGHMAVKFGKAFGLKVTVLSTSESKRDEAISVLGADNFVVSSDKKQMESLKNSLDFIVDTASGDHPFDPYLALLKVGGVMALVGFPGEIRVHPATLNLGARTLSGSVTGGTKDTQEMMNFCAANKIYPEIEVIKIDYVNEALERLVNRDVRYRFVIDIEGSFK
ncbi:putative cinnamyl alcohol dehydrogenase 1 [Triticum urartu]|uniref:cinnamyl-alcohol dehydrogenase n=1 Tax=Triticum urartu TaxID=4572 RepID=M7ZEF7_TRIUA|nr:putative cinnamyl alcohol dehydrogenase 1 [Triticum urartu]